MKRSLPESLRGRTGQSHGSNLLIRGDNLTVMRWLLNARQLAGQVRLIYIDPPFGTRQKFTVSSGRNATISRRTGGRAAYGDQVSGREYLDFLRPRLTLMRELLSEDGSIYVHIDVKMGHYVKVLMDEVFGERHFISDICRIKCNPKNFVRKGYGNVRDMILFYSKTRDFIWNDPKLPAFEAEIPARFNAVDESGRRYMTTPLHAPGETQNGATGQGWRGMRPPPGRHWRYPPQQLEELDRAGLIEWSSTGNPRKRIYADDVLKSGVRAQDVWLFKDPQTPHYPTQKNREMLELIVKASSLPGDIVLDAFCGSGTTLCAAGKHDRRWIGIDQSDVAIEVCREQLAGIAYEFVGETSEGGARCASNSSPSLRAPGAVTR